MSNRNTMGKLWFGRGIKLLLIIIFARMLLEFDDFYEIAMNFNSNPSIWDNYSIAWLIQFSLFLFVALLFFINSKKYHKALHYFSFACFLLGLWEVFLLNETFKILGEEAFYSIGKVKAFLRYSLPFLWTVLFFLCFMNTKYYEKRKI